MVKYRFEQIAINSTEKKKPVEEDRFTYGVYRNDDDSLTDTVTISQNEAGIDTEDRIIKLKKYIANMK